MTPLRPGERISDTLVADRLLGEGAYAQVYRVRHEFLGWQALKLFKRVTSLEATRELLGEARLLSTLGHPNIVRVFDASTIRTPEGHRGYFTMEYVAGGSLHRLIRLYADTAVPIDTTLTALEQIASALAAAHRQRPPVLHRDLTLDNVLVGYDEHGLRVRLSDFGLAKHVDPRTQLASAQGTFAFMPPEVIGGAGYSAAGDVWAWGTLAYLLLTQHFPYQRQGSRDPRSLVRFRGRPLPPSGYNADVDPTLDDLVLSALNVVEDDRPADAGCLYDRLCARSSPPRPAASCDLPAASGATERPAASSPPGTAPSPGGSDRGEAGDDDGPVTGPGAARYPDSGTGMTETGVAGEERAGRLASEALELARRPSKLAEAADVMEEAVSLSVPVCRRHLYRLRLWRRGMVA